MRGKDLFEFYMVGAIVIAGFVNSNCFALCVMKCSTIYWIWFFLRNRFNIVKIAKQFM